MILISVWTLLCTAGIAFNLRFLVALCKDRKPRLLGYWVRLRLNSSEGAIAEPRERTRSVTQVA
jgi:hypothetical protein